MVGEWVIVSMCEHCVGWFLRNKEYGKKLCFLDPDNLVEINDSTPTCEHFELEVEPKAIPIHRVPVQES